MNLTNELSKCSKEIAKARESVVPNTIAQPALADLQNLIHNEIVNFLDKSLIIQNGFGMGSFADVPWIVIRDKRVSINATSGFYISILFSKDGERTYIALSTAAGASPTKSLRKSDFELIKSRAVVLKDIAKKYISAEYFNDNPIDLASNKPRPQAYISGIAAYKEYIVGEMNKYEDDFFRIDLTNLIRGYLEIVNSGFGRIQNVALPNQTQKKFNFTNIHEFSSYCKKLAYVFN